MLNVPIKVTGAQLTADEFNDGPMTELLNAVISTNQTLTDADLNQLPKTMCNYAVAGAFFSDTGVGDALVLNTLAPLQGITEYFTGMTIHTLPNASNTGGAATANVNSLGLKNIKTPFGLDPSPFDIRSNHPLSLIYNGTDLIISSTMPNVYGNVRLSANQSVPQNVNTTIEFDTVVLDFNSGFDAIAHEFVPKVRGIYSVTLQLAILDLTNASFEGIIFQNGVGTIGTFSAPIGTGGSGIRSAFSTTSMVSLNGTTDGICAIALHTESGARDIRALEATYLTIALIQRI